jgi:ribonuclease P protein component
MVHLKYIVKGLFMSRGKRMSLSGKSQFDRVFKEGARASQGQLSVIIAKGNGQHGLIVPKTIGNAVIRNRWRRQLRPILADNITDDRDLVVLVRKGEVQNMEYDELQSVLTTLFGRAEAKLQQKLKQQG